jgi:hypothetical protein
MHARPVLCRIAVVLSLSLAVPMVLAQSAGAASGSDRLNSGETLSNNGYIKSPSGKFMLVMQPDGNLVQYVDGLVNWATNTSGHPGNWLAMQTDGNLVMYNTSGTAVWWTGTGGQGPSTLYQQDDGNFVVYRNSNGGFTWGSNTQRGVCNHQGSSKTTELVHPFPPFPDTTETETYNLLNWDAIGTGLGCTGWRSVHMGQNAYGYYNPVAGNGAYMLGCAQQLYDATTTSYGEEACSYNGTYGSTSGYWTLKSGVYGSAWGQASYVCTYTGTIFSNSYIHCQTHLDY